MRGLVLYDDHLRALLEAANPQVFGADPLKQQLFPDEVQLHSPIYDHLALRHFVLSTGEVPYGTTLERRPAGQEWDAIGADGLDLPLDLTEVAPGTLSGFAVPLRVVSGCRAGNVEVELHQGDRVLDAATKPARDALGTWTAFGIDGRDLAPGMARVVVSPPSACELEVGRSFLVGGEPALRLIVDDPEDGVALVATEGGWVYERPEAWPIVSVHTGWQWFDEQDAVLAHLTGDAASIDPEVVPLVGDGDDQQPSGTASLEDVELRDETVTATVRSDGPAIVVLAQDMSDGWSVEVDGRDAPLESVDGTLMGVRVGSGTSEVRFEYAPASFRYGLGLTASALLSGVAALVVSLRRNRAP